MRVQTLASHRFVLRFCGDFFIFFYFGKLLQRAHSWDAFVYHRCNALHIFTAYCRLPLAQQIEMNRERGDIRIVLCNLLEPLRPTGLMAFNFCSFTFSSRRFILTMHPRKYFYGFFAPFSGAWYRPKKKSATTKKFHYCLGMIFDFAVDEKQLETFERLWTRIQRLKRKTFVLWQEKKMFAPRTNAHEHDYELRVFRC